MYVAVTVCDKIVQHFISRLLGVGVTKHISKNISKSALDYHSMPSPGKISVVPTKPLANQRDLALAYSPGVASASLAIAEDPSKVADYTIRSNLVAVITNGTAVLGLGDIGPLAAKPVMEGKAVLFKKFAGIDVFDIEINEKDPQKLVDIIASLEPSFGGINLEDIKAPECFEVEEKLKKRMTIPVFHDDQHGTAIIVAAAIRNGLRLVKKDIAKVKLVCSGAGAAALACLDQLLKMGLKRENVFVSDLYGVVYKGREMAMDPRKAQYAQDTKARKIIEVMQDADIFLGLSAPKALPVEAVAMMAKSPLILALANPEPEILPEDIKAIRQDAIIATGRSDYPNQVNNVLCFPFIFRGALDVGATEINDAMKLACIESLANLAMAESSDIVARAYGDEDHIFGPDYLIPKPFDPRLILDLPIAVAKAAMQSGVATRPILDFEAYKNKLNEHVYKSSFLMRSVLQTARKNPMRLAFAEGEEEKVLRAVQVLLDEKLAHPILIGRPDVIAHRVKKLGLRLKLNAEVEIVNPEDDPRFHDYWSLYHSLLERQGITPSIAKTEVRTETTLIGTLMMRRGEADALLCGLVGTYPQHYHYIYDVLGLKPDVNVAAALNAVVTPKGTVFLTDTYLCQDPSVEQLSEITLLAADMVKRFGLEPKVALLSHSNFGSSRSPSAQKMRDLLAHLRAIAPWLEVEGEMHADIALQPEIRSSIFPNSHLEGMANLLIMPNLDAANIALNLLKSLGDGLSIGPMLLGAAGSAHILTPSTTVRGIVNMAALAIVDAQSRQALKTAKLNVKIEEGGKHSDIAIA
jgi:malate dehydrogenase (oxaloacetate-decarboxylating)(NADP+)